MADRLATSLRGLMWLCFGVAALNLLGAIGQAHNGAGGAGATALLIFFCSIALAGLFGWMRARRLNVGRDQQSRSDAILLLVAELGRHDDATLDRIARQGGPAGEAAGMVMQGRKGKK